MQNPIMDRPPEGESMDIHTKPGAKVLYDRPMNGSPLDKELAAQLLRIGDTYTVKRIDIRSSVTHVEVVECPGYAFSSSLFSNTKGAS